MKKLQPFDASSAGHRIGADQVVVFAFKDETVDVVGWGKTFDLNTQAQQWADKRFGDFVAGALRPPNRERVKRRCEKTQDMFA